MKGLPRRLEPLKGYAPLLTVTLCSFASYTLVALTHWREIDGRSHSAFLVPFLLGISYTHFFEYSYHRLVMHTGAPRLDFIKKSHRRHHRVFYGENFTSQRSEDWQYIASPWFVFPALLTLHYFVLQAFVSPGALVGFFGGALLHYLAFEFTHWLTHVEDNVIDRWVNKIPALGPLRGYQIRHHRAHHEIPTADFNFNLPFLGDVIFGTLEVPPANPVRRTLA